ncbi:hypothetical protein JQM60_10970 [Butyricicoccus pullicaecorum]|nr:hypothetical protein [Butyricicoccus pullicaecorum]
MKRKKSGLTTRNTGEKGARNKAAKKNRLRLGFYAQKLEWTCALVIFML